MLALIPAVRRQKLVILCESEASLVYSVSTRTARAVVQRNSVMKNQKREGEARG